MKEKDLDKDTIVAYHAYLQTRIHNELNGVGLGPGWLPCRMGLVCIALSMASFVTGVLVITLRHRHVYLVDWWHAFVGPFFIILFLILMTLACYLIITAKRRSNQYRRELFVSTAPVKVYRYFLMSVSFEYRCKTINVLSKIAHKTPSHFIVKNQGC